MAVEQEINIVAIERGTRLFRTLFISDVHLSARAAARPAVFWTSCAHHDAETIYLVGDIVDGWQLRSGSVLAAAAQRRGAEATA